MSNQPERYVLNESMRIEDTTTGEVVSLRRIVDLLNVGEARTEALRDWLGFENVVEPPSYDAPYQSHLAYEQHKLKFVEAAAEALRSRS